MEIIFWYQVIGAVFAGNVLTFMFGYFVWTVIQREKKGLKPVFDVGLSVSLCGIIPPLLTIGGLLLMKP